VTIVKPRSTVALRSAQELVAAAVRRYVEVRVGAEHAAPNANSLSRS